MTYQEFKKELYRTISNMEDMEGKEIHLLEAGKSYKDGDTLRIIRLLNLSYYNRESTRVLEDMIYVIWGHQEMFNLLHWKVRIMYERFQVEGWQAILPEITAKLHKPPRLGGILPIGDGSYEQSCERLIIRPLNYDRHQAQLQDCIYWTHGDIALVLYGLLSDSGDEYMSIKVNRHMAGGWGMTDEMLLTNALLNSCVRMPPRLYDGRDIRPYHPWTDGVFMPDEPGSPTIIDFKNKWEQAIGYRLSTVQRLNGAVAIFYPGVQERLAQLMGGDYFVGFTSLHEAVIHPVRNRQLPRIKSAIKELNAIFDEADSLSDSVYRYSMMRKELIEV